MAQRAIEDTEWYNKSGADTPSDKMERAEHLAIAAHTLEHGEDNDLQPAIDVLRDWAAYVEHELGEDPSELDNLADAVEAGDNHESVISELSDRAMQLQMHALMSA